MKLKNIIKRVNRRTQLVKDFSYDTRMTGLSAAECLSEMFMFTRKLKELGLENYEFPALKYGAWLYDMAETNDYSFLRLIFGKEWWYCVDIYHHRGWIDEETKELNGVNWGIINRLTRIRVEFDTFEEFRIFFKANYSDFGFILNR